MISGTVIWLLVVFQYKGGIDTVARYPTEAECNYAASIADNKMDAMCIPAPYMVTGTRN